MNVGFESVGRMMPLPFPVGTGGVSVAKAAEGGWKAPGVGLAELARVSGEEAVDERELTRDDPLGNLVTRAFDPAGVTLPALGIGLSAALTA